MVICTSSETEGYTFNPTRAKGYSVWTYGGMIKPRAGAKPWPDPLPFETICEFNSNANGYVLRNKVRAQWSAVFVRKLGIVGEVRGSNPAASI
jgi:hypothetical protein